MDQCRCFRHQSLTAATARAKRLLAVTLMRSPMRLSLKASTAASSITTRLTSLSTVLDRLAPFLSSASGAAAVDDAFGVGFDFNTHVVEAALGPAALPA